jgi:hypothetical protein
MRRGISWLAPRGGSKPRHSLRLKRTADTSIAELKLWFSSLALPGRALVNGAAWRLRLPASIPNAFMRRCRGLGLRAPPSRGVRTKWGFRGINGRHPGRIKKAAGPRHLLYVPHFLPAPCYSAFATWQGFSSSCCNLRDLMATLKQLRELNEKVLAVADPEPTVTLAPSGGSRDQTSLRR